TPVAPAASRSSHRMPSSSRARAGRASMSPSTGSTSSSWRTARMAWCARRCAAGAAGRTWATSSTTGRARPPACGTASIRSHWTSSPQTTSMQPQEDMSTAMLMDAQPAQPVADGLVAVVKRDCPTCRLVAPVLAQLNAAGMPLTVYSQDDPTFPEGLAPVDDTALAVSYRLEIEAVPALLRLQQGRVVDRLAGWSRADWEALTGVAGLGPGLPHYRPGCGSRSVEPGIAEELAARYGGARLRSRRILLGELEDEIEACYARGWTDGLPVVPPTRERVLRMLEGTSRDPAEVVAVVPPDLV